MPRQYGNRTPVDGTRSSAHKMPDGRPLTRWNSRDATRPNDVVPAGKQHNTPIGQVQVKKGRLNGAAGREWLAIHRKHIDNGILNTPMMYPTHSTSGPISVMNAHMTKCTAHGYKTKCGDSFFDDYAFSNVTALYTMSNGATVRIAEYRELAYPNTDIHEHEIFRIYGTDGTFAHNRWLNKKDWRELSEAEMRDPLPPEVADAFKRIKDPDAPADKEFVPTGHGGSHPYLVHEFVDAVANDRVPAINVWEACRYMAAGVAAHQSALKDGETVDVPDWGDAP